MNPPKKNQPPTTPQTAPSRPSNAPLPIRDGKSSVPPAYKTGQRSPKRIYSDTTVPYATRLIQRTATTPKKEQNALKKKVRELSDDRKTSKTLTRQQERTVPSTKIVHDHQPTSKQRRSHQHKQKSYALTNRNHFIHHCTTPNKQTKN